MSAGRPLRIAVVIDDLWVGGAQLLLSGFAVGARNAGLELSVAYLHDQTDAAPGLRAEGIEPSLVPVSGIYKPGDHRRLRRYLAQVRPDIVHTHVGAADVMGGLAARAVGIPAVSTLHSAHWSGNSVMRSAKVRIQAAARRRSNARVIAVCDAVRDEYIARGWDTPERVVTVHNGILDRSSEADRSGVRQELGIGEDEIVVTMVGALARDKGQSVLAEAARSLADRFPQMRVLIVGDGPLRERIAAEVAGLGGHATMIGHRDDVPRVLAGSDVLVYPTRVDALPTVVIEAMAAGLPIVTTRIGGIPEMIRDGENGLLIAPPPGARELAGAMESLLERPDLRRRLGSAARRRFEDHFTIEHWFDRLLPVYEGMLGPGPRRP